MAGVRPGDAIIKADDMMLRDFPELQRGVAASPGKPLQITILRDHRQMVILVTPATVQSSDSSGAKHNSGQIGIRDTIVNVGIVEAFAGGTSQTWSVIAQTADYVGQIVTGRQSPDQLHGIIGIAAVSYEAARDGFVTLLGLAGLMSVSIGLVNLLPVPVLDGGHLLYYACEAVREENHWGSALRKLASGSVWHLC